MLGDLHSCKSSFMYCSHDPPTFSLCGFKWLNVLPLTKMRMITDTSTLLLLLSHAKLLFCSHFEYQIDLFLRSCDWYFERLARRFDYSCIFCGRPCILLWDGLKLLQAVQAVLLAADDIPTSIRPR